MRALAHVEEASRGRQRLVITEIPYQINKRSLEEKIAQLVRDGKLEGISDLRDESDRQGMRLVIELNQNADPDKVLQSLYRRTTLESRFSFILLALVNCEPRRLSLKRMLLLFIEHRLEVLNRRSRYLLDRARDRAHIVEGLLVALDNLDRVIDTIRRSRTPDTARRNLERKLKLSAIQAQAILDMPLKRLVSLERRKLRQEYKDLQNTIQELEALLASPKKQRRVISEDLQTLKARYDDTRHTHILDVKGTQVATEALTPDEPVWVTVARNGLVGYVPDEGKAPPRVLSRPDALPVALLSASTRDTLYLFTAQGNAVALPVHQVGEGVAWEEEGSAWSAPHTNNALHAEDGETIAALTLPSTPPEDGMLFFATAQGKVKRLEPEELPAVGRGLTGVIRLDEGDRLVGVEWVRDADEVVLASSAAQGIRFEVAEVRPSGARAGGVSGIRLDGDDVAVGVAIVKPDEMLLTITSEGLAKCSAFDELSSQRRGGKGVLVAKLEDKERLTSLGTVSASGRFFPVTERDASKTVTARSVPTQGRATRGESIIALRDGDIVVGVVIQRDRIEEG
jgi:DNA gyrase subunit A